MDYREDETYKELEKIIGAAGVKIQYCDVPDDSIDGAIWARSDIDGNIIIMPNDGKAFPDSETACNILGHEMGHILSGLESVDQKTERRINEAVCDLIGCYLTRLADMTVGYRTEQKLIEAVKQAEK